MRQVALELRDCGAAVPVVVCGRNEALAEQLRADGIEHAYGWVDDMPALMHAADVLIQNAGGLSSLEAFATGLPVASYRCIPGHGLTNAAALDEAGVAVWIRDPTSLKTVLCDLIEGPLGLRQLTSGLALFTRETGDGPAAEIARVHRLGPPFPTPRPIALRRRPATRRLAITAAAAGAVWACAVGTGIATAYEGPGVLHTIGRSLDLDDPAPVHVTGPYGHHS
jgi:glycosyltransferase involved in cell wall biosynthesis